MTLLVRMSYDTEMKKNPKINKDMIDNLKDWMLKQPHLPDIPDVDLLFFLHSCYYSVEKAKHTIDLYFTMRTHITELFHKRDPRHHSIKASFDVVTFSYLPEKTPKGERVMFCRFLDTDPNKYIYGDTLKNFLLVMDLELQRNGTADGDRFIFDMRGMGFGHFTRINLYLMKNFNYYFQEAVPVRFVALHVLYPTSIFDKLYNLAKPFVKQELLDKVSVFNDNNLNEFYKFIPKSMLPKDYGGNAPTTLEMHEKTIKDVYENFQFYINEEKIRINESLRIEKSKMSDSFSVEGSFKKLDID